MENSEKFKNYTKSSSAIFSTASEEYATASSLSEYTTPHYNNTLEYKDSPKVHSDNYSVDSLDSDTPIPSLNILDIPISRASTLNSSRHRGDSPDELVRVISIRMNSLSQKSTKYDVSMDESTDVDLTDTIIEALPTSQNVNTLKDTHKTHESMKSKPNYDHYIISMNGPCIQKDLGGKLPRIPKLIIQESSENIRKTQNRKPAYHQLRVLLYALLFLMYTASFAYLSMEHRRFLFLRKYGRIFLKQSFYHMLISAFSAITSFLYLACYIILKPQLPGIPYSFIPSTRKIYLRFDCILNILLPFFSFFVGLNMFLRRETCEKQEIDGSDVCMILNISAILAILTIPLSILLLVFRWKECKRLGLLKRPL